MTASPLRRVARNLNPRLVVVFAAIALIPLIYAGLLTTSNLDPTHRLETVPAVIVNDDTGATASDGTALELGDDVTDELTSSTSSSNFAWTTTDADDAASRLASGAVYAVLTIPSDFSADVASVGGDDPAAATAAKLSLETNDAENLIAGNIASTIGTTVTEALEKKVGETYLQNVYLGLTDVHDSLEQAADGAGQLADGASRAADGSSELVVGLEQLRDGTAQLSNGAASLRSGADSASSGASALWSGLETLADGTAQLPQQTGALNDGAQSVAAGAQQLDGGAAALSAGAADLATGTSRLSTGAASAADGAQKLAVASSSVSSGAQEALDGATALAAGAGGVADGSGTVASGSATVSADVSSLVTSYDSLTDAQRRAALTELQTESAAVATGAAAIAQHASGVASKATALVGGKDGGLTAVTAGAAAASSGATDLATGTQQVAAGAGAADAGAQKLAAGAQQLATGASSLDSGSTTLAGGVGTLAGSVGPLTTGIADAASGASTLASGTAALATGADALADGASTAAAGSADAASGSQTLENGVDSLAEGSQTLDAKLNDGAGRVPRYSDEQARELSEVAAAPVSLDAERLNKVPGYGYGLAPYFLSLALWVGALAFYLMSAPLRERLIAARRPAWEIALRSYLPGALIGVAQAVLAVLMLKLGVGIDAASLTGLIGIAVLTSVTFIAINQALIALLDAPGRFLALVLIVLQLSSAGATYPIETSPGFFQVMHGVLPMTYTVEAFRSLIAGGSIGVANAVLVLSLWLVAALALTMLAAARRRRGLVPALTDPEPLLESA